LRNRLLHPIDVDLDLVDRRARPVDQVKKVPSELPRRHARLRNQLLLSLQGVEFCKKKPAAIPQAEVEWGIESVFRKPSV
jgi:hypothetical protein